MSKDKSSVYENLYILSNQGYIVKQYDKTYRKRGRPASYYLETKGIGYLREHTELNQTVLRNFYKSKNVSEEHIDHCLMVMATFMTITKHSNRAFDISTKYELTGESFFAGLKPLPDLYLSRKKAKDDKQFDYMLDIFDPYTPFWVIKKRLNEYEAHCDEVEFDDGESYPYVLLVVPTERIEQRVQDQLENMFGDFEVYTTTIERLSSRDNTMTGAKVWREVFEEDEFVELSSISVNP